MSQTTAPTNTMVKGTLGIAAQPFSPTDVVTKVQPAAKSYFGRLVVRDGVSTDKVKHPAATISDLKTIEGVVQSTHALECNDVDDPGYAAKDAINVLKKGYIYVAIEEKIAVGDAVFVRFVAGAGGTKLGAFRNDADTASAVDISSVAKWVEGGSAADGVALLSLNLI